MADFVGWILLGLFAGAIARRVMPGEEKGGCLVTIIMGILGAVIGGWIGRNIGFLPDNNPGDWLPSLGFHRHRHSGHHGPAGAVEIHQKVALAPCESYSAESSSFSGWRYTSL